MWECCTWDGENWIVDDWHLKDHLIDECERNGWDWFVIRYHRDKTKSIVKSNVAKKDWPDVSFFAG